MYLDIVVINRRLFCCCCCECCFCLLSLLLLVPLTQKYFDNGPCTSILSLVLFFLKHTCRNICKLFSSQFHNEFCLKKRKRNIVWNQKNLKNTCKESKFWIGNFKNYFILENLFFKHKLFKQHRSIDLLEVLVHFSVTSLRRYSTRAL